MSRFKQCQVIMQDYLLVSTPQHSKHKQRHVIFDRVILDEEGSNSEEVCRLTLSSSKRKLSKPKPPQQIILDKEDFCGLIKNVQIQRNLHFRLSLTVVMRSMCLTMFMKTDSNTDKYDQWCSCLEQNLKFGGYWPVEEVHSEDNEDVILSLTNEKLVVLRLGSTGDDQYDVKFQCDKQQLLCWNSRHCDNLDAYLTITNAESRRGLQNLVFKIHQNRNIAQDIETSLKRIEIPNFDISKPPPIPPRTCQKSLPSKTSHYENEPENEYWSIVYTLRDVLKHTKCEPDTLRLGLKLRQKLCIMLLNDSLPSWKDLAGKIGLTQDGVNQIQILFGSCMQLNQNTSTPDVVTPTECVLRHWQSSHNHPSRDSCVPPCNRHTLSTILSEMGRYDLAEIISTER